jgi:hypothetical protein
VPVLEHISSSVAVAIAVAVLLAFGFLVQGIDLARRRRRIRPDLGRPDLLRWLLSKRSRLDNALRVVM